MSAAKTPFTVNFHPTPGHTSLAGPFTGPFTGVMS